MDTPGALRLVAVGYGHPDAVRLVAEVQAEYVERYGGEDEAPIDPLTFDPPAGTFLVGYLAGPEGPVAVASGAWRASTVRALGSTSTAEVKRMYVHRAHRGAGHARRMLAELERTAASCGHDVLVLETGTKQPEAIALYESAGYQPVPGFGHYADSPLSRCFAKRLDGVAVST